VEPQRTSKDRTYLAKSHGQILGRVEFQVTLLPIVAGFLILRTQHKHRHARIAELADELAAHATGAGSALGIGGHGDCFVAGVAVRLQEY
jgi:hypothetical protein